MKTVLQSLWKSTTLGILVCESISKNISVFSIRHLLFLKISRQQYEKVTEVGRTFAISILVLENVRT